MRRLIVFMLAALLPVLVATPASAQKQRGLVNINVSDNTVLVPVAIAANICNVTVAILVSDLRDEGETTCVALAESEATVTPREGGGGAGSRQEGLINVNIENNVIQIPIAAAANICDVSVFVLVSEILLNDATRCRARAGAEGIA
jgi:hypothetical protein